MSSGDAAKETEMTSNALVWNPNDLPIDATGGTYRNEGVDRGMCPWCLRTFKLTAGGMTPRHGWRESGGRRVGEQGNAYHIGGCRVGYAVEVSDCDVAHVLASLASAHASAIAEIDRIMLGGDVTYIATTHGEEATISLRDGIEVIARNHMPHGRWPDMDSVSFVLRVSSSYAPEALCNRYVRNANAANVQGSMSAYSEIPGYVQIANDAVATKTRDITSIIAHAEALQTEMAKRR